MKFIDFFCAFVLCVVIVLMSAPAHAESVQLSWTAPETPPNFDKYRIYWGEKTGEYTNHKEVGSDETSTTVWKLAGKKTYYFVATTVMTSGQESIHSNEVSTYLDVDTDQDGILDQQEMKVYGTDPNQADTDGDGINDGEELAFWQDAWDQDADGDGKINLLDHDADDDGLMDGAEINEGTDPLVREVKPEPELDLALLTVVSVQASGTQEPNVPANTLDGELQTRWSSEGDGEWITYDIGSVSTVSEVAIAWFRGDRRASSFSIEISIDGTNWKEVFSHDSSGTTQDFESYPIPAVAARYVRIVGYGNSDNMWNSITEVELYGQLDAVLLSTSAVYASGTQEPNVPANTLDGELQTRWSLEGDGEWITYDIGSVSTVSEVAIAWFRGDRRASSFSIEISIDGTNWKEVFSHDSSGTTQDFESYPTPAVAARYVRIVGYGNSDNMWNSITEVELYSFGN